MTTRIMKFGGTSVIDAEAIARVAKIVQQQVESDIQVIVVVSAMGGVTDRLTRGVYAAEEGDLALCRDVASEIYRRTRQAADALIPSQDVRQHVLERTEKIVNRYESVCESVCVLEEVTPRALDRATSCGEPLVAALLAAHLESLGIESQATDAEDVIVTDDTFQNAAPLLAETRVQCAKNLSPLLSDSIVPVIGGFIGATTAGVPTTLGRGGSDFTAAILGHALAADDVWIWTDVDGVMSADPRRVPSASVIPVLSYEEVAELAYFGAGVLHPHTIRPLVDERIPLWIKNTFRPELAGTRIDAESQPGAGIVKAVTDIRGLSIVTVQGRGNLGVPNITARTFEAVARCHANVLMISHASSEQSICFVIPVQDVPCVQRELEAEFAPEIARCEIDCVESFDGVSVVTAMRAGMRGITGVAGRLFMALDRHDVNIIAIAQGSSECSISVVVTEHDVEDAVLAIHEEVIKV